MPPKSSNKKKRQSIEPLWHHCTVCGIHIPSKERLSHDIICPMKDPAKLRAMDFVFKGTLCTNSYKEKDFELECLNYLPEKQQNNMIYMSDGVFRLLDIRVGNHVVITSMDGNNSTTLVRTVWPIPEQHLTTIYIGAKEDFEECWSKFNGRAVKVEPIQKHSIRPAKIMCVALQNWLEFPDINAIQIRNMEKHITREIRYRVFALTNELTVPFFNKKMKLVVQSVEGHSDPKDKSLDDVIVGAMKHLKFDAKIDFFLVAPSTKIFIKKAIRDDDQNLAGFLERNPKFHGRPKTNLFIGDTLRLKDLGGMQNEMQKVKNAMLLATGLKKKPKGLKFSKGVLIYGNPGCGKTLFCDAICVMFRELCGEKPYQVLSINNSKILSKFLGESEQNLRAIFEKAYNIYPAPTIIVIEDIHLLIPKNDSKDLNRRLNACFYNLLDELSNRREGQKTFILATTGDLPALNPCARRSGRIDLEVEIPAPNAKEREQILKNLLYNVNHELSDDDIATIGFMTHGFVAADLVNLVFTSSLNSLKLPEANVPLLNKQTFMTGMKLVKPSAMREIMIQHTNVHWHDIGGYADLKLKLKQSVEWPIHHPEKFKKLGIKPPKGVLLYGPPGCSKTMFAKALATESNLNFISVKGPEIFSMWVGESEKAIRNIFTKAREVSPSIVFFDEIDSIGGERADSGSGSSVRERVLTQLLTELDGVESLENVIVVATTNRPDMIDKALLRPGRIDRLIYVGLPDQECREEIFKIKLKDAPIPKKRDCITELAKRSKNYTGAEIENVCHEAALKALQKNIQSTSVEFVDFEYALDAVKPRTSAKLLKLYEEYQNSS